MGRENKKFAVILLLLLFISFLTYASHARRTIDSLAAQKNYYSALQNLMTKYLPQSRVNNFMGGFFINQRLFSHDSPQLQEVCRIIRKSIFELEDHNTDLILLIYLLEEILPEFQVELYNFKDPRIYGEVLNIITREVRSLDCSDFEEAGSIYWRIISRNADRDDEVGAFFAQLFNRLYIQTCDFEQDYDRLQIIISGDAYLTHTKHRILSEAMESIVDSAEDLYIGMPELDILVEGIWQRDLYIQFYSTVSLALLCTVEGIPAEVRKHIFNSALEGVKNIPWDICFDRSVETPEEVKYLAVSITYLADAEEACREEFGLDVDLSRDEQFIRIYHLLLLQGFDFNGRMSRISEN
ncbi:MAG: hypothetical protein PHQ54_05345 [Candidatus Omnitrophica bacterium]|nr:hypothetical protein [Candidatus Omnitrophota bacterium]